MALACLSIGHVFIFSFDTWQSNEGLSNLSPLRRPGLNQYVAQGLCRVQERMAAKLTANQLSLSLFLSLGKWSKDQHLAKPGLVPAYTDLYCPTVKKGGKEREGLV